MGYKFDYKIQLFYGALGFLASLGVLYFFMRQLKWDIALIIGIVEFGVSGFYTRMKCDVKK